MFVQFIEGTVNDPASFRRQLERWAEELAGEASGWLGTTAGVTAEGTAFLAARFDSEASARANSDRPEQSAWWAETEALFAEPPVFQDAEEALVLRHGGSDDAGFVQVIRGRVNDLESGLALMTDEMDTDTRPDVIGGTVGMAPDGAYTMVVYFTSEEEARAGEREEAASDEGNEFARRLEQLHDSPPVFLDLSDPWMWSA